MDVCGNAHAFTLDQPPCTSDLPRCLTKDYVRTESNNLTSVIYLGKTCAKPLSYYFLLQQSNHESFQQSEKCTDRFPGLESTF